MRSFVIGIAFIAISSGTGYATPIYWSGNGHYYDFVQESRTWSGALTRAGQLTFDPDGTGGTAAMAGYLVTITSAEEQEFLNQNFGNSGLYWISASDGAVEGTWRWAAGPENGTLLTYTNWKSGEPNNGAIFQEDVAVANYGGVGLWNDWLGFVSTNFVVEYSATTPTVANPEPASIVLLLSGLAGLVVRRRLWVDRLAAAAVGRTSLRS
jgi:Lectin C-type domain